MTALEKRTNADLSDPFVHGNGGNGGTALKRRRADGGYAVWDGDRRQGYALRANDQSGHGFVVQDSVDGAVRGVLFLLCRIGSANGQRYRFFRSNHQSHAFQGKQGVKAVVVELLGRIRSQLAVEMDDVVRGIEIPISVFGDGVPLGLGPRIVDVGQAAATVERNVADDRHASPDGDRGQVAA